VTDGPTYPSRVQRILAGLPPVVRDTWQIRRSLSLHAERIVVWNEAESSPAPASALDPAGQRRLPNGDRLSWSAGRLRVEVVDERAGTLQLEGGGRATLLLGGVQTCCDVEPPGQETWVRLEGVTLDGAEVDGRALVAD
jgi:hypothetical protein